MNWFKGDIAAAVQESKARNAVFVVYVEGKDESTQKLTKIINEPRIRSQLESDDFVAIKIESESQAYMQFATIYQVVPVPSIFFIGKSGTPLDIGTGVIASVDELAQKIEKVLAATGKTAHASASASSSFIATEQKGASVGAAQAEADSVATSSARPQPQPAAQSTEEIVCEGDVCYKKPKEAEATPAVPVDKAADKPEVKVPTAADSGDARLEETRKVLEEKRRERVELEKKQEKERELRRRHEGKEMQKGQQWQKEQELKELKDNIRRDRLEEQAARERIRAQIAADRAERAHKTEAEHAAAANSSAQQQPAPPAHTSATDTSRLQFRFANGDCKTNTFNCNETLSAVRDYVRTTLLPGTGIKDFTLATTYPKREFTAEHDTETLVALGLHPSAVILIIGKESSSPSAIIARSGGIVNILTTLFWTILSPVFTVFGYIRNIGAKRDGDAGGAAAAPQKRANEEQGAQYEAAKRRNLERFTTDASTSKAASDDADTPPSEQKPYRRYGSSNVHRLADSRKDSDDENATWNGNSTQQQ